LDDPEYANAPFILEGTRTAESAGLADGECGPETTFEPEEPQERPFQSRQNCGHVI